MRRVGKHVHGLQGGDGVSVAGNTGEIAGERLRIAGDIHRRGRADAGEDVIEYDRLTALTRWIENDRWLIARRTFRERAHRRTGSAPA